jgi:hypothetical protein
LALNINMVTSFESKPLPVESLLPYPQRQQSTQSLDALRDALQQAQREADGDSQVEDDGSDGDKPSKRPKRARACIACRNMKIRCLPVDGQEACLACSKVNRECVMPGPARKRQKTVHKVAELEKKINALTEALIAKNGPNPTPPNDSPANDRTTETQSDFTRSEIDPISPNKQSDANLESASVYHGIWLDKGGPNMGKADLNWGCNSKLLPKEMPDVPDVRYNDPIDRGLMDMATATAMFDHYVSKMLPHFPCIAFPSYVKAEDVRAARPTLFLAVITAASSAIKPQLQSDLLVETSRLLAQKILFAGEKTLELVQAVLVYTAYYTRSKYAKDLAFNQFIHSAVVMCLDLGMGRKYPQHLNKGGAEEAEVRRTWLACYYFASSVSTMLRHPSLVRWSPYIEECVQYFSTSPFAIKSDAWLCTIVNGQHIAEEVSIIFSMDDPTSAVTFGETKTQYHLKAFEQKLAAWKASAPAYMDKRLVEHMAGCFNLYIHEIAIHTDHNVDDFRLQMPNIDKPVSGSFITTMHIDALTTCLDSCHRVLNSYLALDLEQARALPNLYIVWNTYAVVGLMKLAGVIQAPDSAFSSIFTPDIRVDYYLSAVLGKLTEVSAEGRCPPAESFVFVIKKLASWHQHKRAPWIGEDGNTQQPNTQQVQAEGLTFRSLEENKAEDRASTNLMRNIPEKMGLPEKYGGIHLVNQGYNMIAEDRVNSQMPPPGLDGFGASQTGDVNAAMNAANYNLNWDELNFSQDEMNVFDTYMSDQGWMGYLL